LTEQRTLVWFRRDLRLRDNPALFHACAAGEVIPVFILDDADARECATGEASRWWLHHSLVSLNEALNGRLLLRKGRAAEVLQDLVVETNATAVYWNRCYEPWQTERDALIKSALKAQGVNNKRLEVKSFQASLLWEPWEILNQQGSPYKVFTPYYRKGCLKAPEPRVPLGTPSLDALLKETFPSLRVDDLALMPSLNWYQAMDELWQPGEEGAAQRLERYLENAAFHYRSKRNFPAVVGTSQLSPSLHFGELSPNQVWYAAQHAFDRDSENEHLDTFLSELGWREFSHYLLFHFPNMVKDNFNPKFDAFQWENDPRLLKAWQQGQTGIPIVDAGMRELWQTGYMHNRVRMVVGSFLVKNLRTDWRLGEAWFRDCLVDADLAANVASWQWVAGSGADASPYFRIFNPVLQGEKFDGAGDYVKRYCPELSKLEKKYIHKPWEAPAAVLAQAGIELGRDYPAPIVDLKASREAALIAYEPVKGAG
jgi:deoxyribodipyrimidine photo-lyase